ncbi:MAG: TylF/MycF/NovP-related O-methyltransferase [Nitrosotalea sp.]
MNNMNSLNKVLRNIEYSRNTPEQLQFYTDVQEFLNGVNLEDIEKLRNFPVFTWRQQIRNFLEKYELYNLIKSVPGSILECGVADGFGLMSYAHFCSIFEGYHHTRKVIGFDTFEGFTDLLPQDKTSKAVHMRKGGLRHDSYSILQTAIKLYDRNRTIGHIEKVQLVKGDISQTLPLFLKENPYLVIALLYLDMDLYQPTKDAIRLLVDRIPKGGIICFDEINHQDYPGETIAVMEELGFGKLRLKRFDFSTRACYAVIE